MKFVYRDYDNSPITSVYVSKDRKHVEVKNYKYLDEPVLLPFGRKTEVTYADVEHFFERRTYDKNRSDLKDLLHRMGLRKYDPLKMCIRYQGRNAKDGCWIDFQEV